MDSGKWTAENGQRAVDSGQFKVHSARFPKKQAVS
jgi:hypothetical protein